MIYPNSYNLTPEEDPYEYKPEIHKGNDIIYKKDKVWPRVYHKHLTSQTRSTIYGEDEADALFGNVVEIGFEPLNSAQIDFLRGEQRK